jgi:hypothetical protein
LSKNPKNAWKSLAGIVLCLTGIYAFSILMWTHAFCLIIICLVPLHYICILKKLLIWL